MRNEEEDELIDKIDSRTQAMNDFLLRNKTQLEQWQEENPFLPIPIHFDEDSNQFFWRQ